MADPFTDAPADQPQDPAPPVDNSQTGNVVEPAAPTDPCSTQNAQIADLQTALTEWQQRAQQAESAAQQWQGQAEAAQNQADQYRQAFETEQQQREAEAKQANEQIAALQASNNNPADATSGPAAPVPGGDQTELDRLRAENDALRAAASGPQMPTFGAPSVDAAAAEPNYSAATLQDRLGGPMQSGPSRADVEANPRGLTTPAAAAGVVRSTDNVRGVPDGGTVTGPGEDPVPTDAELLPPVTGPDGKQYQGAVWTTPDGKVHMRGVQFYPEAYVKNLIEAARASNEAKNAAATQDFNRQKLTSDEATGAAQRENVLAAQRLSNQGALDRVAAERGATEQTRRAALQADQARQYTSTQEQAAAARLKELEIASANARANGQMAQDAKLQQERLQLQKEIEGMRLATQAEQNRIAQAQTAAQFAAAPRRGGFNAPRYKR